MNRNYNKDVCKLTEKKCHREDGDCTVCIFQDGGEEKFMEILGVDMARRGYINKASIRDAEELIWRSAQADEQANI